MKIMCLHPFLSMRAVKEMSALKKLGHEIFLVYEGIGSSAEYDLGDFWDQVIEIPHNTFTGEYYFRRLLPIAYKKVLKDIINKYDFDLIHAYSMPDTLAVSAIRYSGLPVVFDARDVSSGMDLLLLEDLKMSFMNKLQDKIYRKIIIRFEREANQRSEGRIYVSKTMLNYMQKIYNFDLSKTTILPNYQCNGNVPECDTQKISDRDGEKHLVYIGNILFDEYQRTIKTLQDIANNNIHIHIYPAGDKKIIADIKELFGNSRFIHFHCPLKTKQLLKEIQQYDFGLVPRPPDRHSLNTRFALPNKFFDYLAAGLPVAAKNTHAIADFIEKNRVGFIYNTDLELIKIIKENSTHYEIDNQKFTMENHIHQVVSLYNRIIQGKGNTKTCFTNE